LARAKRGFAQVTHQRSGRFAVRYTTPAGGRISAGRRFARKADAEAWATDRRRELLDGDVQWRSTWRTSSPERPSEPE
jgi:hypothetical protein